MSALLDITDLRGGYGKAAALDAVSLRLDEGRVLALLGRNGMGKSTTIRAIMGVLPWVAGQMAFGGRDLAGVAAHKRAQSGLGWVPEGRRCFAGLSVAENLICAARPGPWDQARVEALFPRLAERRGQLAATLSGGEQQMLAIGRALMTNPRLLLLDEATEGLAPVVRAEIWAAIEELKTTGMSMLVVDKSLAEILPRADTCVILERGRSVWTGAAQALEDRIAAHYLGV